MLKDLRDLVSCSKNRISSLQRGLDEARHDLGGHDLRDRSIREMSKCITEMNY